MSLRNPQRLLLLLPNSMSPRTKNQQEVLEYGLYLLSQGSRNSSSHERLQGETVPSMLLIIVSGWKTRAKMGSGSGNTFGSGVENLPVDRILSSCPYHYQNRLESVEKSPQEQPCASVFHLQMHSELPRRLLDLVSSQWRVLARLMLLQSDDTLLSTHLIGSHIDPNPLLPM